MIRSDPFHVRASARVNANINAVALGPKMTWEPCAPSNAPTFWRTASTKAVVCSLAAKCPPTFAGSGLRR